ncbi:hypothetical protein SAMN04488544_2737 [Microlunatus sagamiharensis]|uniref:Adhesin n=1 Tax=Microlunatus sagamiharensis TaxID=546874 RepID=A0A1H2MUC2_9ACTN|nr:hypothetical protein [Microlunatus sagamiharensis]SDU96829.1 hypothetical protein SAMN04488544_2737 [Microlunatus sagamiharensis]
MSTDPLMSAILNELAAGRIDASEAARRIDGLKAAPPAPPAPPAAPTAEDRSEPTAVPSPPPAAPGTGDEPAGDPWALATDRPQHATFARETVGAPRDVQPEPVETVEVPEPAATDGKGPRTKGTNGVDRITVRVVGRRVRIVGETSVATLSADGPHVLRRNGSTLEVSSDGEIGPSLDGFSILRGVPRSLEDFRALGLGKELLLRVNPALAVDVEVTAGQLSTERVPHLGKIRVTAGGAKLLDVTEVHDVLVQAGSATIKGTITQGRHRVRAESGSLSITLGDDSNVTVKSDAQLGRVSWAGGHSGAGDEVVMGHGNARLDVEVVMGHAQVRVGSDAASAKDSE